MHCVRVALFSLKPGKHKTFEETCALFAPKIKSRPGFRRVTFYLDDRNEECGAFVEWESKEHA